MTQFTFSPPSSPTARAWLQAAAEYLDGASPSLQRQWLQNWIVAVREFPLIRDMTAFDKSLVIVTLEKWASQISKAEAA